jgi:hypothetical protein
MFPCLLPQPQEHNLGGLTPHPRIAVKRGPSIVPSIVHGISSPQVPTSSSICASQPRKMSPHYRLPVQPDGFVSRMCKHLSCKSSYICGFPMDPQNERSSNSLALTLWDFADFNCQDAILLQLSSPRCFACGNCIFSRPDYQTNSPRPR